ncbi:hypothetical protein HWV62_40118 [Athelia sp. TMB]|nr:hypothetical protein HWV62_40118 [Athelia sp. TMB]
MANSRPSTLIDNTALKYPWEASPSQTPIIIAHSDYDCAEAEDSISGAANDSVSSAPAADVWEALPDDIRTEYHPQSRREPKVARFEDYGRQASEHREQELRNAIPWEPYQTRLDFELSELMLEAALNKNQTSRLISLIRRAQAASSEDTFTIKSYSELVSVREQASKCYVDFDHRTISVPYKQQTREYEVHFRPLMQWALHMVDHPRLAPQFTWDAERISKWNGYKWVRVYHEPWTADHWWSVQSQLPKDASMLCFCLYADKTKLSSFGTEKGYPIMARIANLPVHIRNGNGVGGGQVVGWLPIVAEDAAETKKTGFVNHKNAVWHTAFLEFLSDVKMYSETGLWHMCGDKVMRRLFTIILILSADYEEQCIMALIRGLGGIRPCPKCLILFDNLSDFPEPPPPPRTASNTMQILDSVKFKTGEERENILKANGLRYVPNALHQMRYSDVNLALSFDRLHTNSGLFDDHLWAELKRHIQSLGRPAIQAVDENVDAVPRWRNLNHFKSIMQVSFTDGSKHEDMLKAIVFATHSVITAAACPLGYLLLRCLRLFVVVDMYTALEVHTEDTIAEGREAVRAFGRSLTEYIKAASKDERFASKNWNFIKAHLPHHIFDDVTGKGVTRNYTTKPNEKLHGPLKNAYRDQTNFKDVAMQILKVDQHTWVNRLIRDDIEAFDELRRKSLLPDDIGDVEDLDDFKKFAIGSKLPPRTYDQISEAYINDLAFRNFRANLNKYLSNQLGCIVRLNGEDMLQEHRFLKVNYESQVDWRTAEDFLRCNPQFHGQPRYDFVMYESKSRLVFAQLVLLFKCQTNLVALGQQEHILALVHPYDQPIPARGYPQKDKHLGLLRYRSRSRKQCEFIAVGSIIRGALLVTDPLISTDGLVVDVVDCDMFLRLKSLHRS